MEISARFFGTVAELRAWFEAHHADTDELWVGFYKAHTGRAGVVYPEAVDEALCFGWIDTTVRRIDDERYANRFTPRREGSYWSVVNRRRYRELDSAGRVHEAGRRAFERKPALSRRQYSSEVTYRLTTAFSRNLAAHPTADRYFRSRTPSYRKRATFWVMSAARPETRERRFAMLLEASDRETVPRPLLLPGEVAPPPAVPPARSKPRDSRHRQSHRQRRPGSR